MLPVRERPTFIFIENRKIARSSPRSEDARQGGRTGGDQALEVRKCWQW